MCPGKLPHGAQPRPAEDVLAQVDAAVALLRSLDAAAAAREPDLVLELLAQVVTKVELWFSSEQQGKRVRRRFARALVWVREDVALVLHEVHFRGRMQ